MRARTANGIEPRTLGQFAGTRVVPRTCALLQVVVVFALSGAVTRNTPQETDRTSPHENISVQVHTQEQLQRKAMPASIHMHQQGTSGAAPQVLAESRIPRGDGPSHAHLLHRSSQPVGNTSPLSLPGFTGLGPPPPPGITGMRPPPRCEVGPPRDAFSLLLGLRGPAQMADRQESRRRTG
jgi:hypothetical protein